MAANSIHHSGAGPAPENLPRQAARIVVALRHERLRQAVAKALEAPGAISVVGRAEDIATAIELSRAAHPDALVLGSSLLRGDVMRDLRATVSALPGVSVVVVGTDGTAAFGTAMRAAGAAEYVALDLGAEALALAVRRVLTKAVPDAAE
jgi:DNA-binding NarL/FixJ family response regulator